MLAPTRELALQVQTVSAQFAPGRLIDFLEVGKTNMKRCTYLVSWKPCLQWAGMLGATGFVHNAESIMLSCKAYPLYGGCCCIRSRPMLGMTGMLLFENKGLASNNLCCPLLTPPSSFPSPPPPPPPPTTSKEEVHSLWVFNPHQRNFGPTHRNPVY